MKSEENNGVIGININNLINRIIRHDSDLLLTDHYVYLFWPSNDLTIPWLLFLFLIFWPWYFYTHGNPAYCLLRPRTNNTLSIESDDSTKFIAIQYYDLMKAWSVMQWLLANEGVVVMCNDWPSMMILCVSPDGIWCYRLIIGNEKWPLGVFWLSDEIISDVAY